MLLELNSLHYGVCRIVNSQLLLLLRYKNKCYTLEKERYVSETSTLIYETTRLHNLDDDSP